MHNKSNTITDIEYKINVLNDKIEYETESFIIRMDYLQEELNMLEFIFYCNNGYYYD